MLVLNELTLTLTFATRKAGVDGVKAALEAIIMAQAIVDVNTNFIVIEFG